MFEVIKKQKMAAGQVPRIEPQVAPFFVGFLVAVCLFMSVMLFGAGNIFGGLLFGAILWPVYILATERPDVTDPDEPWRRN